MVPEPAMGLFSSLSSCFLVFMLPCSSSVVMSTRGTREPRRDDPVRCFRVVVAVILGVAVVEMDGEV